MLNISKTYDLQLFLNGIKVRHVEQNDFFLDMKI